MQPRARVPHLSGPWSIDSVCGTSSEWKILTICPPRRRRRSGAVEHVLHRPVISGIARSGSPARLNSIVAFAAFRPLSNQEPAVRASERPIANTNHGETPCLYPTPPRRWVYLDLRPLQPLSHAPHAARATIASRRGPERPLRQSISLTSADHIAWVARGGFANVYAGGRMLNATPGPLQNLEAESIAGKRLFRHV